MKSIKDYHRKGLNQIYTHSIPEWMNFWIFIHQGMYKSGWKLNYKRVFCYFGRHKWGGFRYGYGDTYHHQCMHCGFPSDKLSTGKKS